MGRSYYSDDYYGRNNGLLAIAIGFLCVWGFCKWAEHSAIQAPVTRAEEELKIARSGSGEFRNEARIKSCEQELVSARKYVDSGQSERDLEAHDRELNKNSRTTKDLVGVCIAGLGLLVFGWRTVRGVATPLEVFLALGSGILTVIMVASFGLLMFIVLFAAGIAVLMACSVLGNDVVNRARWVRDEYDEDLGVNKRRTAMEKASRIRRR